MRASISACSDLASIVFRTCLLMLTAGCSTMELLDPAQETISSDAAVIAFSVDKSRLTKNESWIRPLGVEIEYGEESVEISLDKNESETQRVLLELPARNFMFSEFEVESGAGIYWSRYQTGYSQPLKLAQGEITYLGRISIEDALFSEEKDGPLYRPYAVKLVFTDELEDDLSTWRQQYVLFRSPLPVRKAITNWTGQDYLDLSIKRSSGRATESFLRRAMDGGSGDLTRGPAPEDVPN